VSTDSIDVQTLTTALLSLPWTPTLSGRTRSADELNLWRALHAEAAEVRSVAGPMDFKLHRYLTYGLGLDERFCCFR
jgi:hypothetical protein